MDTFLDQSQFQWYNISIITACGHFFALSIAFGNEIYLMQNFDNLYLYALTGKNKKLQSKYLTECSEVFSWSSKGKLLPEFMHFGGTQEGYVLYFL